MSLFARKFSNSVVSIMFFWGTVFLNKPKGFRSFSLIPFIFQLATFTSGVAGIRGGIDPLDESMCVLLKSFLISVLGASWWLSVENHEHCNAGDVGLIPGLGRPTG